MSRRIRGYAQDDVELGIGRKIAGDFGPLFAAPSVPIDTSEDAAAAIQPYLNGLRAKVLAFIEGQGLHGATADEVEIGTGLKGSTVRPRLIELELVKRIQRLEDTRETRSGRAARVYIAREVV